MKVLKICLIFLSVLTLYVVSAYSLEKNYTSSEEEEVSASDYIGISMEIPIGIQNVIGIKTVQAEKAEERGKVHVTGRISQDVDEISEIYAPQRGVLKKCLASLGVKVKEGQVICLIESEATKESIEIKSPSSGIIVADFSKPGDTVDSVSPIHTIADFSKLPISFDVYEKDVGKVQMGQKVLVYSSAYSEQTFEGKIIFVSPRVDETSFTMKIRVLVDNPDYLLKPGMFVRGEILLDTGKTHVSIPSHSVQNLDGIDVVFLKDEEESFIPMEVEVTYSDYNQTLVKGDVNAGDLIVVEGAYILKSKIMESEITGGCLH